MIETKQNAILILEPRGRIDTNSAKRFGDRVAELMRGGSRNMVIDMQHIVYITSAGFHSLLIARKLAEDVEAKFVLCGLSAELKRLFEIGAFTDLFTICATRADGIAKAQ